MLKQEYLPKRNKLMYNDFMIYKIKDTIIKIYDKTQFNPEHILECGQVFRFGKDENDNYFVISKDKRATIIEKNDCYEILSNNPNYFVEYFDLDTDYTKIKTKLKHNKILAPMVDFGYGIRILKADPLEMIFSFTISQNNNIKRIKQIVEKLCKIGKDNETYNSFPTIDKLFNAPLSFYESLGAGYRAKFLKELSTSLKDVNLEEISKLSTDEIYKFLINLKGVGPKVASCILLFGFHKTEKFPVDTWIEQVYYNHFSKEKRTRPQIQEYFEKEFKEFSGLAQQYLFYYERNNQN